jgi:hypothetical protein
VFSKDDGIIPDQFIALMPKLSMNSIGLPKGHVLANYGSNFKAMGIKPLDVLMRPNSDILLMNATSAAVEQLRAQGARVFPSRKLKPTAIQASAPWQLTVRLILERFFI